MRGIYFATAAAVALAASAAFAQTGMPAAGAKPHHMMMKPVTRAEVAQKVQQHFARLDTNRDGFVTRAEADAARQAMRTQMTQRMQQRRAAMFDRLDANNDGSISRAEFDAAHAQRQQRMGEHGGKRIVMMHRGFGGKMFETADADRDGRVSLAEATAAALARFDRVDINRDGTLTPEEMRQGRQRMRGNNS